MKSKRNIFVIGWVKGIFVLKKIAKFTSENDRLRHAAGESKRRSKHAQSTSDANRSGRCSYIQFACTHVEQSMYITMWWSLWQRAPSTFFSFWGGGWLRGKTKMFRLYFICGKYGHTNDILCFSSGWAGKINASERGKKTGTHFDTWQKDPRHNTVPTTITS